MRVDTFAAIGSDGLTRRGILTHPQTGLPKAALVLLPAGTQPRSGPGRLYVDLADRLAKLGIATLRIDARGVGESDGSLEVLPTFEQWRQVESGAFVPDGLLAVRTLGALLGPRVPVYAGGLCGGGLTALAAAAEAPGDVAGIVTLNIAVRVTPRPGQASTPVASEARASIGNYARKILKPSSWPRALSGGIRLGTIVSTATAALRRTDRSGAINPLFSTSFDRARAAGVEQLHLFGGRDVRWHEFHDLVLRPKCDDALDGRHYRVRVMPDAEHHFVLAAWRQQAAAWIAEWMSDHARAGAAASPAGRGTSSTLSVAGGVDRISKGSDTL